MAAPKTPRAQACIAENSAIVPADILAPEELASRLKVPPSWVFEKTRQRKSGSTAPLPVFKIGRYLRFNWADVSTWLESTRRGAPLRKGLRHADAATTRKHYILLKSKKHGGAAMRKLEQAVSAGVKRAESAENRAQMGRSKKAKKQ